MHLYSINPKIIFLFFPCFLSEAYTQNQKFENQANSEKKHNIEMRM